MKKIKTMMQIVCLCIVGSMSVTSTVQAAIPLETMPCCGLSDTTQEANDAMYMKNFGNIFKTMQQKMSEAKETGNPSLDFVLEMIPHHEAAVAMSKEELKYGSNAEVKQVAQSIIQEQEAGIEKMKMLQQALEQEMKKAPIKDDKMYLTTYQDIYQKMVKDMGAVKATGNVDKDFLLQMIPHHEGAIAMANNILQYTKNTEIIELAKNIAESQNIQLKTMKEMVQKM